ncbi:MAG: pentapeptide repeat-containing protein [Alphaproteobacteria bacterium]|nr:pentapeptide repeat-containing protein [Alphaproteobacteria bacterium]
MTRLGAALTSLLGVTLTCGAASAVDYAKEAGLYAPSVWELKIGAHARELPRDEYIDFACGTNGGPPSIPLRDWREFAKCPVERGTNLREVYFRYDDEPEFWARANGADTQIKVYEYTSVYSVPVIASGLFDENGFLVGLRLVTDPRMPVDVRENAISLNGYLLARFGEEDWTCQDLPRLEGDSEFRNVFIKRSCRRADKATGLNLLLDARYLRRAGQAIIDPVTHIATEGQFESTTRLEMFLPAPIENPAAKIAALPVDAASPRDALIARARDCPGCDLTRANLKRADLRGAKLAGANLTLANLHGANLAGADLTGALLTNANVNRADLRRAKLGKSFMHEVMLFDSRLDGADLGGADLTGALAGKIQLTGAKLQGAKLLGVDFRNARLNDADFTGADLTSSWFHDARIERANFTRATLNEAVMWAANLTEANLTGVIAEAVDLYGAMLRGANMSNGNFAYSRLTGANMADAKTEGANWTEADLPIGFTPR